MKKLKILIVGLLTVLLCACNADVTFGSFSFHYVHVQMYNMSEPTHFKVSKWKSDDGGIELKTEEHGTLLLGDGTYMLYDVENCPICGHVEYK